MSMNSDHRPPEGYEEVAFYGINSTGELPPDLAAKEHAARYRKAYVHTREDGFQVFANLRLEEILNSKEIQDWLNTPIEEHIRRWKKRAGK